MRLLLLAVLPLLAGTPQPLAIQEGTRFELTVEKTGLLSGKKHIFSFPVLEGAVTLEPPTVELALDARAVLLHDDWVTEKDRRKILDLTASREVLDTASHPRIIFRSTRIAPAGEGRYQVTGPLTLRGISREITVEVTRSGDLYTGGAVFPMSRYGIKPPKAALGAVGTRDLVTVNFTLKAES
ncbi:MAG: YceI family protein [Bryobacteraceae bacterium]|nr:YceI family protein [Bryobacteraceae bacterium]